MATFSTFQPCWHWADAQQPGDVSSTPGGCQATSAPPLVHFNDPIIPPLHKLAVAVDLHEVVLILEQRGCCVAGHGGAFGLQGRTNHFS